jgi:hypothetical protein
VTVALVFGVKPLYMLLALALAVWLWRRRERELVLIRWSMLAFFAGELSCALNVMLNTQGDALELGHQAGMIVFGMFLPWGLWELFDRRSLGFSDRDGDPERVPKPSRDATQPAKPAGSARERACSFQRLCQRCWKREAVPCGLHRLMLFVLPCLAFLALLPLTSPLRTMNVRYEVFGTVVPYVITPVDALMTTRIYPLMAAWLFVVAFVVLLAGRPGIERAKAPFFLGMGFLTFALLRFSLLATFWSRPFWSDSWEELTELFTIGVVVWLLWSFRHQLSLVRAPTMTAAQPSPSE